MSGLVRASFVSRNDPDATISSNRTMVYTWRTDLAKQMCQVCSDFEGLPVELLTNNCTKKRCKMETKRKQQADAEDLCRDNGSHVLCRGPVPEELSDEENEEDGEESVNEINGVEAHEVGPFQQDRAT